MFTPASPRSVPTRPLTLVQLCDTFLLCPVREGLLIVDQHSAHERVHYERLRERLGTDTSAADFVKVCRLSCRGGRGRPPGPRRPHPGRRVHARELRPACDFPMTVAAVSAYRLGLAREECRCDRS